MILAVALVLSAVPSAVAKARKTPDAEFKALIQQYYDAWSKMNADAPAPLYARDADLVFYDVAPLKYTGWEEYKRGVQTNLFDQATSGKLTAKDDLKVTRRGKLAWTTVTFHLVVKMKNGQTLEGDGRHTAIWEKRLDKWVIVHEHVSLPLPG